MHYTHDDFLTFLKTNHELGTVEEVLHSLVKVRGLPEVHPSEIVVFENGEIGYVLSLSEDWVEVMRLSAVAVRVGQRVARTKQMFEISVNDSILGKTVTPLANGAGNIHPDKNRRPVEVIPKGIVSRREITEPLITGVVLVDLLVPLGKGQRELVIGDRKTGKTQFVLQTILAQSKAGMLCIYAAIGRRRFEIQQTVTFLKAHGISEQSVIVASTSSDIAGLIFLTPYTAMTIAEYFRDQGKNVLVIFDDLTTHARYAREIALLGRRFPGRNSYPGDIFYIHSRLLERGGNYAKGSITCLPVAESVNGNISGFIETNLMAMTDGHIFFDSNLFNQGRRPAVNSFLSVTRVGFQTRSLLMKDISIKLSSFFVRFEETRQISHFGSELSDTVKQTLDLGNRLIAFFDQGPDNIISVNANVFFLASIWGKIWNEFEISLMKEEMVAFFSLYEKNQSLSSRVDALIHHCTSFTELVTAVTKDTELVGILLKTVGRTKGESHGSKS